MASADLQKFLEDRLAALDPGIDLSPGSPAQTKFISPVITYLGTDPYETDIETFLLDRFAQEFPDIYAGDPGALRDVFVNPLRLILEPFKRESQLIKRNQSLIDPTLLSDDDADALVANYFLSRDSGGYSSGSARIYFSNPIDLRVEVSNRVYSKGNLNFFPTSPVAISAELMVYNREGVLFYFDIPVRAESPGSQYDIEEDELAGVEGIPNVVRVSNLRKFTGGSERQDTETFVASADSALTERSLNTRRGAFARLTDVFKGSVRAVQAVGAKDPEMQRDLLVAVGPGHSWATGLITLYDKVALVRADVLEGSDSIVPKVGDWLYIYVGPFSRDRAGIARWPAGSLPQESRFIRLTVEELLFGPMAAVDPYQTAYFVRWSGDLPAALPSSLLPLQLKGGLVKNGGVKISSLPDAEAPPDEVSSGAVHVYGRTDIYVRPVSQNVTKVVVDGAYDLGKKGSTARNPHFHLERQGLLTTADSNQVTDPNVDFQASGVVPGDFLLIEEGADAGVYTIGAVPSSHALLLSQALNTTYDSTKQIRYRVVKDVRLNLFEPTVPKFPFGDVNNADLNTSIGSDLVTTGSTDLLKYNAKSGDVLRILEGPDAGDYLIVNFDTTLGGAGIFLDRPLTSSGADLRFEVFTLLEAVQRPLVRVREIGLLDSARQSTGISIPPADPVAVRPTGPFTSAKVLGKSQSMSGYVLPDLSGLVPAVNHPAVSGDRRYSMGFDTPTGRFISVVFPDGYQAELDLRADSQGKCSYFLSTTETFDETENFPPISPKAGECLTIKNGPNKGDYLIKAVQKFKYRSSPGVTAHVYFIQIYGAFPVDPLKEITTFLTTYAGATGLENPTYPVAFPGFFSTWFDSLGTRLSGALVTAGVASPPDATMLQTVVKGMCSCFYEWGEPARGVLRTMFREPTLFEQRTGNADRPTFFSYKTSNNQVVKFRPDPTRYTKYELVPPRLDSDTDPTEYPRDLDASTPTMPKLTSTSRQTLFGLGVRAGDVLSVFEEVFLGPYIKTTQALVSVTAGSAQVTSADLTTPLFDDNMVGDLLFIDEGANKGGYRITAVVDAYNVILDRPLAGATGHVVLAGATGTYGRQDLGTGVENWLSAPPNTGNSRTFRPEHVGLYATLYGIDHRYMGSFRIKALGPTVTDVGGNASSDRIALEVPSGTNFFDYPVNAGAVRWLLVDAPAAAPLTIVRDALTPPPALAPPTGTETLGGVPIRVYEAQAKDFPLLSVLQDAKISGGTVAAAIRDGTGQPFRVYRNDVRRITPSEMDAKKEGFLSYFDTEVVSLSPSTLSNLAEDTYLTVDHDSFLSLGYRHAVEDPNFSFSMKETGFLDLPPQVLPVGAVDSPENMVRVVGTPIQVSYERADAVQAVQDFVDSAQDRILSADFLVRHFLPAYVSLDVTYAGGSEPKIVAKDIQSYLDLRPVETPIDVSDLQKLITDRGGNPDTPLVISATIYDWGRAMWVEFSGDYLGGASPTDTKVPYNGSPRVTYFVPGTDVSGLSTLPVGERLNLVRR